MKPFFLETSFINSNCILQGWFLSQLRSPWKGGRDGAMCLQQGDGYVESWSHRLERGLQGWEWSGATFVQHARYVLSPFVYFLAPAAKGNAFHWDSSSCWNLFPFCVLTLSYYNPKTIHISGLGGRAGHHWTLHPNPQRGDTCLPPPQGKTPWGSPSWAWHSQPRWTNSWS